MDYQLDLSYQEIKDKIRGELNQVAESFVAIGYRLKQVKDGELYKEDGYQNINEFAMKEYHLSQSSTSRFIAINSCFSIGGNSQKLLPEYAGYGFSKLSEMLTLSEEEMKLVSIRTTVAEIRTIKEVKKAAEEMTNKDNYATSHNSESPVNTQSESGFQVDKSPALPDGISIAIEFFRDKSRRGMLKEIADLLNNGVSTGTVGQKAAEIINPSGHLMFRKIVVILVFEEDKIKYSKFGAPPEAADFTYLDFLHDTALAFDMTCQDPWVEFYGEPEPEPQPEPPVKPDPKQEKKETKEAPKVQPKEVKKQEKPAEKTQSKPIQPAAGEEPVNLPGQMNVDDYPGLTPEDKKEEQRCRVCGCTENHACEGGCHWVEEDLCSACAAKSMKEDEPEIVVADIVYNDMYADACKNIQCTYCRPENIEPILKNEEYEVLVTMDEIIIFHIPTGKEINIPIEHCPKCGRKLYDWREKDSNDGGGQE